MSLFLWIVIVFCLTCPAVCSIVFGVLATVDLKRIANALESTVKVQVDTVISPLESDDGTPAGN